MDADVGAVTDAAIIESSVQDPETFSTIFDRHAPHIHRYLARRLGVPAADDLVAETFLAAFRRRDRFETTCPNAMPWLYGIATKIVGQHRRNEEREYRLRQAYVPATTEASHANRVATTVTAQSLRRPLLEALATLSDGDRDVLLLIAWEELGYDEPGHRRTARAKSCSSSTPRPTPSSEWAGPAGGSAVSALAIVDRVGQRT
ncbi:RNA polymerase sigma factor [Micromonospora sp. NPDC052213]|uniref:RNA polymerase sigma factor n=1 Tax=Micromonospora sp. NPDC052213 TaxID=3155812 RepID=UPI00344778C9